MRDQNQTRAGDGSEMSLREKEVRKIERKGERDEWVHVNNEGKCVLKNQDRVTAAAQGTYPPRRKYLISENGSIWG